MIRAFQWDLARQAERWDWLMAQLPRYAEWGYQEVYLHLEDAVEFPSVPGVARKDAYSYRQMERLVAAAQKVGMGVVPIVNLLGHTQYLIKVPELRELNELLGSDGRPLERGQICPLHPRTLEVADKLIGDMAPFCTAGKIHVGLDESYSLGRHPLSQTEVEEVGLAGHFGRYVQRLHGLVEPRGLKLGLWADMLGLLPAAVKYLPRGTIAYDWYYYPFRRKPAMELHNFREYDLVPALRKRGVEYWGCPMSGPFRFEPMPTFGDRLGNIRSWWERCRKVKAEGFLVTSWEPSRVAAPMVQALDAAAAGLWLEPGRRSAREMLGNGFRRAMARDRRQARAMAKAALGGDRYAYAGYFRWEIDENWTFGAGRGDGKQLAREAVFFQMLAKRSARWPRPFAASQELRAYLAERDAFVVNGANDAAVAKRLQTMFAPAMRAARDMWVCSRKGSSSSPNLLGIQRDKARLNALPAPVPAPTFRCRVHNFAPALQKVMLQQRGEDGQWRDVRGRFVVEFTSRGAKRRASGLARPFAAPIDGPGTYRLAVRGVGQVDISGVEILDRAGRVRLAAGSPRQRIRIGSPAPRGGFPALDWARNRGKMHLIHAEDLEPA